MSTSVGRWRISTGSRSVVVFNNDDVIVVRDVIIPVVDNNVNTGTVDGTTCLLIRRVPFPAHHRSRARPPLDKIVPDVGGALARVGRRRVRYDVITAVDPRGSEHGRKPGRFSSAAVRTVLHGGRYFGDPVTVQRPWLHGFGGLWGGIRARKSGGRWKRIENYSQGEWLEWPQRPWPWRLQQAWNLGLGTKNKVLDFINDKCLDFDLQDCVEPDSLTLSLILM